MFKRFNTDNKWVMGFISWLIELSGFFGLLVSELDWELSDIYS